jgi:predicted FMN-binding regulatory protein PaiB
MKVDRIDATAKLSQNRTISERRNIAGLLKSSHRESDHLLADWIEQLIRHDE